MTETIAALLVEDNPAEARLIRELLSESGSSSRSVQTIWAGSVSSALDILSSQHVDGILLDLNLPDSHGLETVVRVHAGNPLIPTIILTGLDDEWLALQALQAGAQDYLLKNDLTGSLLLRALRYGIERGRAEEELRRSEAKYRNMFNSAPVGIYQSTPAGRIISANAALNRMLGYESSGQRVSSSESLYADPAEREAWREALEKWGRVVGAVKRLRRRDGSLIWVEDSAQVVRDDAGQTLYFEGFIQDITQRKQSEDLILARARQQAALAEITALALSGEDLLDLLQVTADVAARALKTDFAKVLEMLPGGDELLLRAGVGWRDGLVGTLKVEVDRSSMAGFTISSSSPVVVEDLDKETRFRPHEFQREHGVSSAVSVVVPLRSRIYGVLGVETREPRLFSRDEIGFLQTLANVLSTAIERRRAEEERESLFKRLDLLLKSTGEGIYTVDTEGRCTLANSAAVDMLGYSSDELLGRNTHQLFHAKKSDGSPYPVEECPILCSIRDRRGARITDEVFWRKDGTPITVDYSSFPIVDNGAVRGAVIVFNDISIRKQLEAQLEQAHRVDSLGRVAATIAHEFNNVLMGIQPFAEVIVRSADSSERAKSSAERILESAKRGKRVTEAILRFTRPADPVTQAVDVNAFLESVRAEMTAVLAEMQVLDIQAAASPGLRVVVDALQMQQVFSNLILNARDAMPGGGTITVRAEPCGEREKFSFAYIAEPGRFVHFSVSDHGTGIAAADLNRIFEPLFTTKKSGTGLGLAVARQIVSRHAGLLFVESSVGEGTTFHMFLPREESIPGPRSS